MVGNISTLSKTDFADIERRINENLLILLKSHGRFHMGRLLYETKQQDDNQHYKDFLLVITDSLFESSVNSLYCFYDHGKHGETSVYSTMNQIMNFCREHGNVNNNDTDYVSKEIKRCKKIIGFHNDRIRRLKTKRKKETAHRDIEVLNGDTHSLTFDDIDLLLEAAAEVMNIISSSVLGWASFGRDTKTNKYVIGNTKHAELDFCKIVNIFNQHSFLFDYLKEHDPELLLSAIYYKGSM